VAYSTVAAVKSILLIESADVTYDTELASCIASADALVDGLLSKSGLTVGDSVSQLVADASAYFAAWLFRHRRDPEKAEIFWIEAHKFLDAYSETEEEIAFVVGSSYND
jgi:hypothetical protein